MGQEIETGLVEVVEPVAPIFPILFRVVRAKFRTKQAMEMSAMNVVEEFTDLQSTRVIEKWPLDQPPPLLPPETKALDIVSLAYRGDDRITSKMLRAAIAALPFEQPKLTVIDHGFGRKQEGYANKLEDARKRTAQERDRERERIRQELMAELGLADRQRTAIDVPSVRVEAKESRVPAKGFRRI